MLSRPADAFLQALCAGPLLSAQQQAELAQLCREQAPDSRALARDLIQRGWLTPYQVNQLFQGRGSDLLMGSYLVLERLGEGGTGQVFKARHLRMDRIVALKLIRPELLADPEVVGRFYREVQVLSRLSHPNVVHAYDAGPLGSSHFLVMEYVEGTDLSHQVKKSGALPVGKACDFVRQAAVGLQHAHERGLVHRDIKPSNLLQTTAGQIKVLDLGLARLHKADGEVTQMLTPVGANAATMGTPDYLAPEQALDFHQVDIRADIYGLGCTLFFLLTGQPPFPGGSIAQKLMRHMQVEAPPLAQFRSDAPAELETVLRRMMAKRPEDRFQTPAAVAEPLAALSAGDFSSASLRLEAPTADPPRRRLRPRWAIAAAGLLFVLAAIWLFSSRGKEGTSAERPPTTQLQMGTPVTTARNTLQPQIVELQGHGIVRDVLLDPFRPTQNVGSEPRNNPIRKAEETAAFLVRFDLARLGKARIEKALLTFCVWDTSGTAKTKVCAFPMRTPWEESSATWQQPADGKTWQGGKHFLIGTDTGQASPHTLVPPGNGAELEPPLEQTLDVTAIVQAWLDGSPNYGLAIAPVNDRSIDEGFHTRFQVYASESPKTKYTPKLTVWRKP